MKRLLVSTLFAVVALSPAARADPQSYVSVWEPAQPGIAYAFAGSLLRTAGSSELLRDYTVAAQLTARNGAGVHQWAFGAAAEAWALPGSRSILVGVESAVINEEPTNLYPKIAVNAVMKNREDGGADPGVPMNANSVAFWVSAQPGTGFERGLVFDRDALAMVAGRAAAIDLSDVPDDEIGQIDLIRIRKDVSLRYDPASRRLVLYVAPAAGSPVGPCLHRCIGDPALQQ
jgi:hypothetical protein